MKNEFADVVSLSDYKEFVDALNWLNEQVDDEPHAAACIEIFILLNRKVQELESK